MIPDVRACPPLSGIRHQPDTLTERRGPAPEPELELEDAAPGQNREHFATPRSGEYFDRRTLVAQTGQEWWHFADVVLKELMDNALDAAESWSAAGSSELSPDVSVAVSVDDTDLVITVADNGPGMSNAVVAKMLDFNFLVSDKAAYRSPTRGLQGNALKTVVGIPYALGLRGRPTLIIESRGLRHEITPAIDPAGVLSIDHRRVEIPRAYGTIVTVRLPNPTDALNLHADRWVRMFALVNPHAAIRIDPSAGAIDQG